MSKEIPFTQFLLPDGRRRPTSILVDEESFEQFQKVSASGLRMTVELLTNGNVSQCIEDPALGDFDCVVCANGPDVPVKLKEMLMRFRPEEVPSWKESMS